MLFTQDKSAAEGSAEKARMVLQRLQTEQTRKAEELQRAEEKKHKAFLQEHGDEVGRYTLLYYQEYRKMIDGDAGAGKFFCVIGRPHDWETEIRRRTWNEHRIYEESKKRAIALLMQDGYRIEYFGVEPTRQSHGHVDIHHHTVSWGNEE